MEPVQLACYSILLILLFHLVATVADRPSEVASCIDCCPTFIWYDLSSTPSHWAVLLKMDMVSLCMQ